MRGREGERDREREGERERCIPLGRDTVSSHMTGSQGLSVRGVGLLASRGLSVRGVGLLASQGLSRV